jgi:F-type H+-transporting ATPase subunit epsilon
MLEVVILSPQGMIFSGPARRLILPGEEGVFEVAPFHRPLVSRLLPGLVVVDDQHVPIHRGVVRVQRDAVTLLVEPELAADDSSR